MQYKLSHLPAIKILMPFCIGILCFSQLNVDIQYFYICAVILLLAVFVSHLYIKNTLLKNINAVFIIALIFCLGGLLITTSTLENKPNHYSKFKAKYAKGIVNKALQEKDKSYQTILCLQQVIDSTYHTNKCTGKLMVYLKKDSSVNSLEIGDEILIPLHYTAIRTPKNIAEFDYKKYLQHKAIYFQQYLQPSDYVLLAKHKTEKIKWMSNYISLFVQNILRKYIPDKTNFTLADGILLGHRAELSPEMYNAFAYTGIVHILSVSGLHVGIVYLLFAYFLSFIKDRNKKIKIIKFVVILFVIWLFTFVTGASSACVRATILFTLIHLGRLNKAHTNNLNLLASAAILQLLYDVQLIYDIGFQLSYLAMLGLILLYKPIYAMFSSKNYWIDKLWQLWSASIAAQFFTLPLSIYYFGNFPTYFLIANVFAVPISTIILWFCILLIPLSFIPVLAAYFGNLISYIISVFIFLTNKITQLPYGKLDNLYLTKPQFFLLFFAIICLIIYSTKKRKIYLYSSLILSIMIIISSYSYQIKKYQATPIVLYSINKNIVISMQQGKQQYLFSKDSISQKDYSYSIKNAQRQYRIMNYTNFILNDSMLISSNYYYRKNLLLINNYTFYFINKSNSRLSFNTPLVIDYLFISDNCFLNIEWLQTNFKYNHLLLASDNNQYHINIYKKLLTKNKITYIDISEKYYIINK